LRCAIELWLEEEPEEYEGMNLPRTTTPTNVSPDTRNETGTRLQGPWLLLARAVWVALAGLTLLIFIASIPVYDVQLQTFCRVTFCTPGQLTPDTARILHNLSLSPGLYALLNVALIIATAVVWFTVAAIIFWRKSDDWLALLVSIMLVTEGVVGTSSLTGPLGASASVWWIPTQLLNTLSVIVIFLVFSLFPNGRLVPRWMGWVTLGWIAFSGLFLLLPSDLSTLPSWLSILLVVLLAGFFLALVVAQIHRYRNVSSPLERQQTKWIVFSLAVVVVVFLAWEVPFIIVPSMSGSIYTLISTLVFTVTSVLIPLSFGIAILRYRLWDIDVLINRTLVYGSLTGMLALVYVGLVIGLQFLLRGLINQTSTPAIVVSTLVIAALFQPLRRRIQKVIDRRFYRRKYDAARIVAAFSASLRNEVDLSQLSEQLIAVVQETMQPAHISLWLRNPEHDEAPTPKTWISKPPDS
jgi:hypothetical protein